MNVKELRQTIKKDVEYNKYLTITEHARKLANFENFVTEMEGMHASRKARKLMFSKVNVRSLSEAVMQDGAFRSRCVEIMITVNKETRRLNAAEESVKSYIYARYKPQITPLYRTKIDREHFIKTLLQESTELVADFERITEVARAVIDDIDKFGWSSKTLIEGLKILYGKNHAQ